MVPLWMLDPTPSPVSELDPNTVTPGVVGFVATLVVALATVLLIIDMTRRVRRIKYRAEVVEQLEAERDAAGSVEGQQPGDDASR